MFGCGKHLLQIVHLTDFLKTNLTKVAVKKGQKTGFFAPDKLENHTSEGKGEEK